MKKNLLYVCIASFALFLFACSNKYYTAGNFSEKTEDHKVVAILPAEIVFSGKQPKNLSPENIAKAEETESVNFQYALMNSILRHANTRKYVTTVNFQDVNTTHKILEQNSISVRDSWKRDDNELAKLLGVDAVIRMIGPAVFHAVAFSVLHAHHRGCAAHLSLDGRRRFERI